MGVRFPHAGPVSEYGEIGRHKRLKISRFKRCAGSSPATRTIYKCMMKIIVNGSFDIIHLGHLRLLQYAKSFPSAYVYVLIDTDRRIKKLKGADRPINTEYERVSLLAALKSVDRVDVFDTDEELVNLIREYSPDIMVKGNDYRNKPIIGAEFCKEIKFYDRLEQYSTTNKIQDIANR